MSTREVHLALCQLEQALQRLETALQSAADADELKQDGVIQRFEFTFELLWKTLKRYLAYLGQPTNNPRDTLKAAFREGLLAEETAYLAMLEDRNICTHVYDYATTRRIFQKIQLQYYRAMRHVAEQLRDRLKTAAP
ncbi:MAG: nucleotidyltransferase substrate binding protein [Deltaproteobacteria bacterium]|nr:nucleotidyltransferase substrate binding protein [Deltaproteobacteria bacterium]